MSKRGVLIATTLGVLLVGVLVFGGERSYMSSPPQKAEYSTDLNELRAKFNAYQRKVFTSSLIAQLSGRPNLPKNWMHQLRGVSAERRLDGEMLATELKKLLR